MGGEQITQQTPRREDEGQQRAVPVLQQSTFVCLQILFDCLPAIFFARGVFLSWPQRHQLYP